MTAARILEPALARLDRYARDRSAHDGTPGMAVAVTNRHETLHSRAHGFADLAARTAVADGTLLEIGSIGKSFTAIVLLQLAEAGALDLHAPVARYLPWFEVRSSYEPITVHHLLGHTGGIIMGSEFSGEAAFEVWSLRTTETASPPGTFWHYSNVGYKALGLIAERVGGAPYSELVRSRVLEPLGMSNTEPVLTHDARRGLAIGYRPFYDDRPWHRAHPMVPATWTETATGDGSIASTASDMAIYLRMLMNRGAGLHSRVLSEDGFELMSQRGLGDPEEGYDNYGYGLYSIDVDGRPHIGHGGRTIGFTAHMMADVHAGLGAVVLTNNPGSPWEVSKVALNLLRAALEGDRLPSPPQIGAGPSAREAAAYAGSWLSDAAEKATVTARDGRLFFARAGVQVALEPRGGDDFYADHPDLALDLVRFYRERGRVTEMTHGGDWYYNGSYRGPRTFARPPEWSSYLGHFRSHNPWYSNFRVVARKDRLVLVQPEEQDQVLVPLGPAEFRVGTDDRSPERISFDTIVDGRALRARLSTESYYRTFTP